MIDLQISQTNDASIVVNRVALALEEKSELNRRIAIAATELTRKHLYEIAPSKHATAERLGATPTRYLTSIAELLQPYSDGQKASVIFGGLEGPEIFARVNGPVTVTAKRVANLTIPATAEAYGRRAVTFDDLTCVPFRSGAKALVRKYIEIVPGKREGTTRKEITLEPIYWLKPSVVLPQDTTLLPTNEEYAEAARSETEAYIQDLATEYLNEYRMPTFDELMGRRFGGIAQ